MADPNLARECYDRLAPEYYDAGRHPTCANFRAASVKLLKPWLTSVASRAGLICEVGAGQSIAAELLHSQGYSLESLVITDGSARMLDHSASWESCGSRLTTASAEALPFASDSVSAIVSSLGDPYNGAAFWTECARVLRPGGLAMFTTPAYGWAHSFRAELERDQASFDLVDGTRVSVPSYIFAVSEQVRLLHEAGFLVERICELPLDALSGSVISPKLVTTPATSTSVVTGYLARKVEGTGDAVQSALGRWTS